MLGVRSVPTDQVLPVCGLRAPLPPAMSAPVMFVPSVQPVTVALGAGQPGILAAVGYAAYGTVKAPFA